MNAAERRGGRAFFLHFRARVDIYAEIFDGLIGVFRTLHGAEWGFDFYVVAVLVNAAVIDGILDAVNAVHNSASGQDPETGEHGNDDQDDFESAAAASGTGRGRDGYWSDGSAVTGVKPGAAATTGAVTTAPHLLQNFVPSARVAPQELQNAIGHLFEDDLLDGASIPQKWARALWFGECGPGAEAPVFGLFAAPLFNTKAPALLRLIRG